MKTSVQVVSEIEVLIEVELPSDKVGKELDRQLGEFSKRARVRGFRPGKAPKDLVRKQFAGEMANEAVKRLINESFSAAVDSVGEHRLVGEPQVEPGVVRPGEPFKYAVRAQVKPKIEVHSWKGIEVAVTPKIVKGEEIDAKVAGFQEKGKERVPVEDRKSDTGDIIVIDTTGWVSGARDTRLDMTGFEVKIGEGRMIPGFEDEVRGLSVGESKTFDINFPEDYSAGLAGKPARFEARVQGVFAEELPDVDDDFATDLGFENLEEMRKDIHDKLAKEADVRREDETERRVMAVVLERNQFAVPPAMVDQHLGDRARSLVQMFQQQGMSRDQAIQLVERNVEGLRVAADYQVRRHLVLEAIARQEKIDVDEEELAAALVGKIQERGEKAAKIYERPEMREAERLDMIERKALAVLIEGASIVDAEPEPVSAG